MYLCKNAQVVDNNTQNLSVDSGRCIFLQQLREVEMSKLLQFKPIEKRKYHDGCHCYDSILDKKQLKLVVDHVEQLVYCDHCGNIISPYKALELLCKDWEELVELQQATRRRIRRAWEIGRKYRPHKRVLRDLEKQLGKNGEYKPCCPHCGEAFGLEEITRFRNTQSSKGGYRLGNFNDTEADWSKKWR